MKQSFTVGVGKLIECWEACNGSFRRNNESEWEFSFRRLELANFPTNSGKIGRLAKH